MQFLLTLFLASHERETSRLHIENGKLKKTGGKNGHVVMSSDINLSATLHY